MYLTNNLILTRYIVPSHTVISFSLPVPMLIPQQQGTAFYATSPSYTPPSVTGTYASTLTPNTQAARTQKQLFYCWTHGFSTNEKHTSPTCNFKAQEHKKNATAENMMGGCKRGINRSLAMKKMTVWDGTM